MHKITKNARLNYIRIIASFRLLELATIGMFKKNYAEYFYHECSVNDQELRINFNSTFQFDKEETDITGREC